MDEEAEKQAAPAVPISKWLQEEQAQEKERLAAPAAPVSKWEQAQQAEWQAAAAMPTSKWLREEEEQEGQQAAPAARVSKWLLEEQEQEQQERLARQRQEVRMPAFVCILRWGRNVGAEGGVGWTWSTLACSQAGGVVVVMLQSLN